MGFLDIFKSKSKESGDKTLSLIVFDLDSLGHELPDLKFLAGRSQVIFWLFYRRPVPHLQKRLSEYGRVESFDEEKGRTLELIVGYELGHNPNYKEVVLVTAEGKKEGLQSFFKDKGINFQHMRTGVRIQPKRESMARPEASKSRVPEPLVKNGSRNVSSGVAARPDPLGKPMRQNEPKSGGLRPDPALDRSAPDRGDLRLDPRQMRSEPKTAAHHDAPVAPRQERISPPQPARQERYDAPVAPRQERVSPPQPPRQERFDAPVAPRQERISPPQPARQERFDAPVVPRQERVSPPQPPRQERYGQDYEPVYPSRNDDFYSRPITEPEPFWDESGKSLPFTNEDDYRTGSEEFVEPDFYATPRMEPGKPSRPKREEFDDAPAYAAPRMEPAKQPVALKPIPHQDVRMGGETLPPLDPMRKHKPLAGEYVPSEEDFVKISHHFAINFLVGNTYLKSFLGMAINQATGKTVQEIFVSKGVKPVFAFLVKTGYLEEVDNQNFRVLACPTAETFIEARNYASSLMPEPAVRPQNR